MRPRAKRRGDRGLWSERGGEAVREGFTAFHPRGTRLAACLKMAGDPPAAQVSKDARKGSDAPSLAERREQETKGTRVFAVLRRSHPFLLRSPLKIWGKAPCAFAGAWGRRKPPQGAKAASRGTKCHGVRDARPLQDLRSLRK